MQLDAIFIVGTGRSGTHFLCRSLRGFANIEDYYFGEENHSIRIPLTKLALQHRPLSNSIIKYYREMIAKAQTEKKIFLDQLHTNLYHVDQLIKEFPNALFLATQRPKEQIVASMLNHGGVRKWFKYALKNTQVCFPNKFLGVNSKAEIYNTPEHILCSKRIDAHNKETTRILDTYCNNVRIVKYTSLVSGQENYFKSLFLENELKLFGKYVNVEQIEKNTLIKYKETLNNTQLKDIHNARI